MVPLVPQLIPWDRNDGTVTGTVNVVASSKLQKDGQDVGHGTDTITVFDLIVDGP